MGEAMDTAAIGGCTPQAAICTRGVTRDFVAGQQTITVLHGIDLDIRAGELTFLVGESGSGKTTLISIMCGILWPTLGEVKVFGTDIYDLADTELVEFRLQNIGFIFQQYNLIPSIDAASNAAVPLIAQGMDRHDARERAVAMLEKLNIGDQAAKLPNQLSGGQQQRVALARTVVIEPRVLLLDEPLSNLDANLRIQMRREILELQRKLMLTTIFVTHDQEEANTISDRMAVLNDGVIQQVGAPVDLYDDPANRFVAHFLGTANLIDGQVTVADGQAVFTAGDGTKISLDGDGIEPGDRRTVMFRPQNMAIGAPGALTGDDPTLSGRIQHREFLGSLIRYAVRVGEHVILVDDTHQVGRPVFDVGDDVVLGLAVDQVRILPG